MLIGNRAGQPHRGCGEPVRKGLDGARRSPESGRFADDERLCVVENSRAGQPGGTGYFSSGYRVIKTAKLALRRYLAEKAFGFPGCEDFIDSQPGISDDIALPSSTPMLICIGHSPVSPLAASPLMGSTAQSNRRSNVRRNFMAEFIAKSFYSGLRSTWQRTGDEYRRGDQHPGQYHRLDMQHRYKAL